MIVRDEKHLKDAEESPGEVEQDIADAPAFRALPSEVHQGLETSDSSIKNGSIEIPSKMFF